jgi:DNA-binding IclR family transcriptional regulator
VVGTRRPLYSTAAGHVMLAWSDDAFVRAYLAAGNRRAFTTRTTTDRQVLRQAISAARRSGIAETRDQMVVGVWAVGAPVFDAARNLAAAVMIAAPAARAKQKRAPLLAAIRAAGEEMSRILGMPGPYPGPA